MLSACGKQKYIQFKSYQDNRYLGLVFIDKETNLIVETEAIYSKGTISKGYFEYSDKIIEIPQEVIDNAQEM